MSNTFLAEIRPYGGGATLPAGWVDCDGRLLQIAQNPALYTLLSTRFGGDGVTTFAIPDLRGRVPLHFGTGVALSAHDFAATGGSETVQLTTDQTPLHNHSVNVTSRIADTKAPGADVVPAAPQSVGPPPVPGALYAVPGQIGINAVFFSSECILLGDGCDSQPHENRMPSLAIRYMIAVQGSFPQPATQGV